MILLPLYKGEGIEDRLEKLTAKVDQVSSKTLEDLATYGQGCLVQG